MLFIDFSSVIEVAFKSIKSFVADFIVAEMIPILFSLLSAFNATLCSSFVFLISLLSLVGTSNITIWSFGAMSAVSESNVFMRCFGVNLMRV